MALTQALPMFQVQQPSQTPAPTPAPQGQNPMVQMPVLYPWTQGQAMVPQQPQMFQSMQPPQQPPQQTFLQAQFQSVPATAAPTQLNLLEQKPYHPPSMAPNSNGPTQLAGPNASQAQQPVLTVQKGMRSFAQRKNNVLA